MSLGALTDYFDQDYQKIEPKENKSPETINQDAKKTVKTVKKCIGEIIKDFYPTYFEGDLIK